MAGLLSGLFGGSGTGGGLLSDPMVRLQMGAAMMGGQTLGDQLGAGFSAAGQAGIARRQKQEEQAKINKTLEFLRNANPQLAAAVEAGALDPASAYKEHLQSMQPKQPDYMSAGNGAFLDKNTGEWIFAPPNPNEPMATPKKALQPIYMDDGKGGVTVGQLDEAGNLVPSQLPEGMRPLSPYDKSFQGAQGREMGEFEGSQNATAAKDVATADTALNLLDQIETHPYLDRGVGGTAMFNSIPGTGGYDFQNLVDQAKNGAFLQAVQEMRGLGSLSNAEGSAATSAITRMNTATSKEAFLKAVSDYRDIVQRGKDRALKRIPAYRQGSAPLPQSGGVQWKVIE